ncbi:hypothetical protein GOBAR_DD03235 [Gossypium barbadense]|nr:hypothetical protein GOBAR_DD03235 [Gossypium barbadense]
MRTYRRWAPSFIVICSELGERQRKGGYGIRVSCVRKPMWRYEGGRTEARVGAVGGGPRCGAPRLILINAASEILLLDIQDITWSFNISVTHIPISSLIPRQRKWFQNRLAYDNLAVLLWHSFGIMGVLLKIITSAYRPLLYDGLTENAVTQVCNAIALFQCVASHPDTRIPFIRATMPVYLYPFLNTMSNERSYECLRITSLGVIGSLAKVEDPEVIEYLLSTQIFPSCLRCMEVGKTLSRTVSTFIIYRILLSEKGLKYCFVLAERYLSVSQCLGKLVENLSEDDAENLPHLLKNIIGCYLRLSENERTRPQLSSYIPWKLLDGKYANIVRSDPMALADLRQLIRKLSFVIFAFAKCELLGLFNGCDFTNSISFTDSKLNLFDSSASFLTSSLSLACNSVLSLAIALSNVGKNTVKQPKALNPRTKIKLWTASDLGSQSLPCRGEQVLHRVVR